MNKGKASYFVSILFDVVGRVIRFRMVKLNDLLEKPMSRHLDSVGWPDGPAGEIVDEGEIPFGDDHITVTNRITGWIRYQVTGGDSPEATC